MREGGRREGGREGGRGGADTELKTKTPHVNVGKNLWLLHLGFDEKCVAWRCRIEDKEMEIQ